MIMILSPCYTTSLNRHRQRLKNTKCLGQTIKLLQHLAWQQAASLQ